MNLCIRCLHAVLSFFSEILFGCSHSRVTRPFTLQDQTYLVCLDCGKQIYYSAREMRPLTAWEVRRMKAASAGEVRVVALPAAGPRFIASDKRKPHVAA